MTNVLPSIFKGIALFTPGGDTIYGIDPDKQAQWHQDLCLGLQEKWGLADVPHFLIPGYTATVERWLNPQTQQIEAIAEAFPPVERYIPLLQVLFNLETQVKWQIAPWEEEYCNRAIIETYKPHFPQLWEQRDLIIRLDPERTTSTQNNLTIIDNSAAKIVTAGNKHNNIDVQRGSTYVLRLFISGDNADADKTLSNIHQLLERGLDSPYTLKVIDIDNNPQQAARDGILVTPTLVRVSPLPVRRIVGQLEDIDRILSIITSF